jgi:hypothetical protein
MADNNAGELLAVCALLFYGRVREGSGEGEIGDEVVQADELKIEIPAGYHGNDMENVLLLTAGGYYGS